MPLIGHKKRLTTLSLIICGLVLGFSSFSFSRVGAVAGSQWQADRIIDDSVFYNGNGMNEGTVQDFLNSKVPACDTNGSIGPYYDKNGNRWDTRADYGRSRGAPPPYTCLKSYSQDAPSMVADSYCPSTITAGNKSAARIIYEVSRACNINPTVILITLQKEQSFITDDWPWPIQYTKATGYGCPDRPAGFDGDDNNNGCYDQYEGFFKQIYYAARQFQRYKLDSHLFNHRAGQTSFVGYQDPRVNPNCGGTNITPQSHATAALYNYTPYQPNQAALDNLYGTGDSCSAYGNRNFWRMYNDWFGKSVFITPLLSYSPAIVTQKPGKINAFARGEDGRLWQTWFDHTGWQINWNYIDGPSAGSSAPSAISWGDGHMDVFETRNGALWHSWYKSDNTAWRSWSSLGAPSGVSLGRTSAAVSQKPGKINVFARGSDGRLWQTWFDHTGWQINWNYIDGPSVNSSSPAAISFGDGHMDVFETRNGALWHSWYKNDGVGWRPWSSLGSPSQVSLNGSVAAVSQKPGKINVFARGSDSRLWQTWFDHTGWQINWNYIDGPSAGSSAPSAISWGDGHMDVFETRNGALWHSWYKNDANTWRGWQPIGRP